MSAPMLRFYPHRKAKRMRLERYREAWGQLLSKQSKKVIDLHASADELDAGPTANRVGTAATGWPARRSPAVGGRANSRVRDEITMFRELCEKMPVTHIQKSLASWPVPPLKILVPREGKRILPDPPTE